MTIRKMLSFTRRQLHTIISREIIKPSSPTPSHLQTYNLSLLDQVAPHTYVPVIIFYPNNRNRSLTNYDIAQKMKKSLSQSLTRYYPFAGRLQTPKSRYIDCNDEGVVFVEVKHESQLDMFEYLSGKTDVSQLFADRMMWQYSPPSSTLVGVQLNHFACGGIGVAVCMSHKIGDACTIGSFVNYWASVARYGSIDHKQVLLLDPHLIQYPDTANYIVRESSIMHQNCVNHVTRKLVFPNSKLNDLKNKVVVEAGFMNKLTRVEYLTSLIYKNVITSSIPRLGDGKPFFLVMPVDIRKKLDPKLPITTVGNLITLMLVKIRDASETSISVLVSKIKKEKANLESFGSIEQVYRSTESFLMRLENEDPEHVANRSFHCSSVTGFPYNKFDFGWGKAAVASIVIGSSERSVSVLMDTPNGDGIEAWVTLDEKDMERFQNNKEMLSLCEN